MSTKTIKKCLECEESKPLGEFHNNRSTRDGLHYYCKKCITNRSLKSRGIVDELTPKEKSLLLKYLPYVHESTSIISRIPDGTTKEEAKPLDISEIAQENNLLFSDVQRLYYKFTRLGLVTMIVQGDEEGKIKTLVFYKKDNIKEYIFGE